MAELRVKTEDLKKINISLTQYVYCFGLYNNLRIRYLDIQQEGIDDLREKGHIAKLKDKDEYVLTDKGIIIFEPEGGIFDELLKIFPTRVSSGNGQSRVLSPVDPKSLSGEKIRRKWYGITRNKTEFEEHILSCLKAEVELRKREGNLFYMRQIEAWLNKATWEDYQYLLEKKTTDSNTGFNKVGEIRL